jgi:hypothetical protein
MRSNATNLTYDAMVRSKSYTRFDARRMYRLFTVYDSADMVSDEISSCTLYDSK